jgi:hypothetical protein
MGPICDNISQFWINCCRSILSINKSRHLRARFGEYGKLGISGATNRLGHGDKVRLIRGDSAVNLNDWYVCIRGNRVEQLWPITARGAVY